MNPIRANTRVMSDRDGGASRVGFMRLSDHSWPCLATSMMPRSPWTRSNIARSSDGGDKCRLLENIEDISSNQIDEIYRNAPKNREQAKNNFGVCKTNETATKTKNAASTGMDHGVKTSQEASQLPANNTQKRTRSAMSNLASPNAKAVSRTVGYAITLDDFDGWAAASAVFSNRLTDTQAAGLAWAAMRALEPEQADKVAETVLGDGEMPANLLGTIFGQATFWAQRATRSELKSYAAASFRAMSRRDRAAFLLFAQGSART